jgi:predicted Zn-dependent protease
MVLSPHAAAAQDAADAGASLQDPNFDQVYAAPDDPAINVAYAHAQAAQGHLLYAAAAYERILLEQPDNDAVRLMYIDTLLGLDDAKGAQREIAKLDPLTLDPTQRASLDQYRAQLGTMTQEEVR